MKPLPPALAIAMLSLLVGPIPQARAQAASSATYSSFATIAPSGAATQSATYKILGQLKTGGVSPAMSSSATYKIAPIVAAPSAPTAGVADWSLY